MFSREKHLHTDILHQTPRQVAAWRSSSDSLATQSMKHFLSCFPWVVSSLSAHETHALLNFLLWFLTATTPFHVSEAQNCVRIFPEETRSHDRAYLALCIRHLHFFLSFLLCSDTVPILFVCQRFAIVCNFRVIVSHSDHLSSTCVIKDLHFFCIFGRAISV